MKPAHGGDRGDARLEAAVGATRGVQPWRRLFHSAGGVTLAVFVHVVGAESTAAVTCIGGALAAALILDRLRLRSAEANTAFFRLFSRLASPREADRVASSTWFLVGALAVLLAAPQLFVPAILVLAFADPAASVTGRLWGKRPLGKGTWEGTCVFFLVAAAVLTPIVGWTAALFAAAAAATLEVLPTGLDDNLVVPLATALALRAAGIPV